jgi:predicted enzyme related to lactoylglutathione lyase
VTVDESPATPFGPLDYIYIPAPDFNAAINFYTSTLGGELRWRIHDGGVRVAAIRLSDVAPLVLLASHLERGQTVLIYRVRSLKEIQARLVRDGWSAVDPPFEIPQGPCLVFRDAGGQRLAIYERTRPWLDDQFEGRFDAV